MKDHNKGGNTTWEWQERVFEVVYGEVWCGDSGIADWLNELENDESFEIAEVFLTHLGLWRTHPRVELVLAIVRVSIKEKEP